MISYTAPLWVGIFFGLIIGLLAEIWGISNSDILLKLAKWEDRLFINCISLAIGAGAVLLYGLAAIGIGFHYGIKPDYVIGVAIGAVIFGSGITISGYVPGTEWMALGEGRREAIYAVFGGLLGAATWTVVYQTPVGSWLTSTYNFGTVYLAGKVGSNLQDGFLISVGWLALMVIIAYSLPRYKGGKSCVYHATHKDYKVSELEAQALSEASATLVEGSAMPIGSQDKLAKEADYSWAIKSDLRWLLTFVGVIIGAVVVLEMFTHQIFGESTTYSWVVGYLWMPAYSYSKIVASSVGWEPYSDIGTLLGAFIGAIFVTRRFQAFNKWMPQTWKLRFGGSEIKRAAGTFFGSFLVLFGARMADGCASGHILSGGIQMAWSSIEFFAFVTASLLLTGRLVYSSKHSIQERVTVEQVSSAAEPERKSEASVKLFIAIGLVLTVVVAALTVGYYNGYAPNPNSVAATGFVALAVILLSAVWYKTIYPNFTRRRQPLESFPSDTRPAETRPVTIGENTSSDA